MEHRHLWLRTPRQSAILRVRATIMRAAAEYFDTNGFIRTDPPILTPNACEGTSELFEMDYFDDDKAYLTQSGQLYIEATALALGKVYSFGPTFRAEKSKTRRHLTEFWMIEPEVAFLELDGLLNLAEAFISHIVTTVLEPTTAPTSKSSAKTSPNWKPSSPPPHHQAVILSEGRSRSRGTLPAIKLRRSPRHARKRLRQGQDRNRVSQPTATTSAPPTRPTSPANSTSPSWSTATPPPSKPSTCSPTRLTPPRPSASTSSPPRATAKSSAAASA
jgi:hypothetical protein